MKKTSKLIFTIFTILVTLTMTLVTSFASSVSGDPERTDVYLPSQNINNIQIGLGTYYADGTPNYELGNYSIGQPSVAYYSGIGETKFSYGHISTLPGAENYALANFTTSASGGRLFTRINSSVYSYNNRIPNYTDLFGYTVIDGDPYAWFTHNVIFTFDDLIYDPKLTQGEFTLTFNRNYLINWFDEHPDTERYEFSLRNEITYAGTVLYPTLNNSYEEIPLSYTHVLGAVPGWETTTSGNLQLRTSMVPCENASVLSYDKLSSFELYSYVYDRYEGDRTHLISPKYLADKPIALQDYSVSTDVRFHSLQPETGVLLPMDWATFTNVHYGVPATINGTPRNGERITDFSSIGQAIVEFEDFNFFQWIATIVGGIATVELFPGFTLLLPIMAIIALSVIVWILKVFVGG